MAPHAQLGSGPSTTDRNHIPCSTPERSRAPPLSASPAPGGRSHGPFEIKVLFHRTDRGFTDVPVSRAAPTGRAGSGRVAPPPAEAAGRVLDRTVPTSEAAGGQRRGPEADARGVPGAVRVAGDAVAVGDDAGVHQGAFRLPAGQPVPGHVHQDEVVAGAASRGALRSTRRGLAAGRGAQLLRPVHLLPGEVGVGAAEMTIGGGRRVDRPQ